MFGNRLVDELADLLRSERAAAQQERAAHREMVDALMERQAEMLDTLSARFVDAIRATHPQPAGSWDTPDDVPPEVRAAIRTVAAGDEPELEQYARTRLADGAEAAQVRREILDGTPTTEL